MWLLGAETNQIGLDLDQVTDGVPSDQAVQYAILSHRWERADQELQFDEVLAGTASRRKIGWYKVAKCRQQALDDGIAYFWIDTCCNDKRSSAELQESINSMYRSYQQAAVCYVYLRDVHKVDYDVEFVRSEWFTRGWALQELIAPSIVRFYDVDWQFIGDKDSLAYSITEATGIPRDVLTGQQLVQDCSVAQRFSWAARRHTTRVEDRAYSLLGLFDVSMPMLYGEGDKAFLRLQEEIIKVSDDQSIFAWETEGRVGPGMLASSPAAFKNSGNVRNLSTRNRREPYSTGNRGLSIKFPLAHYCPDTYLAILSWTRERSQSIYLRRLYEEDQYGRVAVSGEQLVDDAVARLRNSATQLKILPDPINVRQRRLRVHELEFFQDRVYGFRLSTNLLKKDSNGDPLWSIRGRGSPSKRLVTLDPGSDTTHIVGAVDITKQRRKIQLIKFGFDDGFNPVVFLAEADAIHEKTHAFNEQGSLNYGDKAYKTASDFGLDKSFLARSRDDGRNWNPIEQSRGKDGEQVLIAKPQSGEFSRQGLWALKGDRLNGLDVYLRDPQQGNISVGQVQLKRNAIDGCLVWDLHIDGLRENFGQKIRNVFKGGKK